MQDSGRICGEEVIKRSHLEPNPGPKFLNGNKFENWENRIYAFLTELSKCLLVETTIFTYSLNK